MAPPAFVVTLIAFLATHPHAPDSYSVYPFLSETFGQSLLRRPVARFAVTSGVFFVLPYLVTGVLLFLADLGIAAAAGLWSGKKPPRRTVLFPESRISFLLVLLAVSVGVGLSLHRIAHGGELPGGVNVAPLFVAAAPFAAVVAALAVASVVSVPRALVRRFASGGTAARAA